MNKRILAFPIALIAFCIGWIIVFLGESEILAAAWANLKQVLYSIFLVAAMPFSFILFFYILGDCVRWDKKSVIFEMKKDEKKESSNP